MGGGKGGSVQMLRSIQRVYKSGEGICRAPLNSAITSAAAKYGENNKNKAGNVLSLSSCNSPRKSSASSVLASTWPSCPSPTFSDDDSDWECVVAQPCCDEVIFGCPPSVDEVQRAVYFLQGFLESAESASFEFSIYDRPKSYYDKDVIYQVSGPTSSLDGDSPFGAKADWKEPSQRLCNSSAMSPRSIGTVEACEAVSLLDTSSHIQRIMEALSIDEAVWDAVKNNELVRELRRDYNQGDDISVGKSDRDSVDSNGVPDMVGRLVNKLK